jgi:hypothetical protein
MVSATDAFPTAIAADARYMTAAQQMCAGRRNGSNRRLAKMPEVRLIDKQETLKKLCETCGYCEKFEKAVRTRHPDFVTDRCNFYKFLASRPTVEADIDRDAILRLCNEIEMIIVTVCDTGYTLQNGDVEAIIKRTKTIRKELTEDAGTD